MNVVYLFVLSMAVLLVLFISDSGSSSQLLMNSARFFQQDGTNDSAKPLAPSPFVAVMNALGRDEDGVRVTTTLYKGPDDVYLSVSHKQCASETDAKQYFEKRLTKSFKIISRNSKRDRAGKIMGEEAEVLKLLSPGKGSTSAILFTVGPDYWEIVSPSRTENINLEKYLNPLTKVN